MLYNVQHARLCVTIRGARPRRLITLAENASNNINHNSIDEIQNHFHEIYTRFISLFGQEATEFKNAYNLTRKGRELGGKHLLFNCKAMSGYSSTNNNFNLKNFNDFK